MQDKPRYLEVTRGCGAGHLDHPGTSIASHKDTLILLASLRLGCDIAHKQTSDA